MERPSSDDLKGLDILFLFALEEPLEEFRPFLRRFDGKASAS